MSKLDQRINKQEAWAGVNASRQAQAKRYGPEPLGEGEVGIAEIFRNEQGIQVKLTDGKVLSGNNLEFVHHEHFTRVVVGGTLYKDTRTAEAKSKFQVDEHIHRCKTEIAADQAKHKLLTTPDEELDKDKQEEKRRLKAKVQAEADAKRQGSTPKSSPVVGAKSAKQPVKSGSSSNTLKVDTPPKERPMRVRKLFDRVMHSEDEGGGTATAERPKAAKKKGAKKAPAKAAKKGAKKKATKSDSNVVHQYGEDRDHDLPWNDKKVAVFKALKACKAVGSENAVGVAAVVTKGGDTISARDVRHYSYHAKAAGLIGVTANLEEGGGKGFFLTKKGAALDPVKELKAQQAAKKSKDSE